MKNKLQYAYSITVFFGVLVTAYMMMNTESSALGPLRAVQAPPSRAEAIVLDPAVNQLFQMEDQLSKLPKEKTEKRRPSEFLPKSR